MKAKHWLFGALVVAASLAGHARAQERQAGYVQIAELTVDPAQLENYKGAAREQIETAIRVEPGVLALYMVADEKNLTHIRVFEVYADTDAYKAHLESAHFKKYRATTQSMVTSLNLEPMTPIMLGAKGN
jgi:quinol monooxygenase YgiN